MNLRPDQSPFSNPARWIGSEWPTHASNPFPGPCWDLQQAGCQPRLHPNFLLIRVHQALSPGAEHPLPVDTSGCMGWRLLLAQAFPPTIATRLLSGACRVFPRGVERDHQRGSMCTHTGPECSGLGAGAGRRTSGPRALQSKSPRGTSGSPGTLRLWLSLLLPLLSWARTRHPSKADSVATPPALPLKLQEPRVRAHTDPGRVNTVQFWLGAGWGKAVLAGTGQIHRHAHSANNQVACLPSDSLSLHGDPVTAPRSQKQQLPALPLCQGRLEGSGLEITVCRV